MNSIEELKNLAQLMTERFSMNPISSQILGESWINAFPDEPAIAHKFLALIAQLEAAQKERDALREVNIGVGSSTRAAADIYFQLVEELEVPPGGSLVSIIDNLKAALSAANEKLSKPVSLPDDGLEDCISMWPDNWRNDFDTGYNFGLWRCEQNIKAAGFTVEGDITPIVIEPAPAEPLKRCAAARDGECHHAECPQLRDNEPKATGRHCPIDNWDDE
ncbi:TPA: hypothetical protein PXP39_004220 [Yersinia enterocolitica]|nr:hypothetical protein [Yersinia enterocolitica]HDL7834263.1 hypothetical protein [Yersinia enterocolitica]HDL7875115.1 hypothetical protein [Yersinia enterocolitica]HDL7887687.1 hypothetical protein [Yersinia enterocolitica]HDL7896294.1 hypothetical protein [Yersinia enterocolitica]